MKFKKKHIRWAILLVATILSMPFVPHWISGAHLWISPFMVLVALSTGKALAFMNLLGLAALVIIFFRPRWICRYACPAGVICDLASSGVRNRVVKMSFPLNKHLAVIGLVVTILGFPVLTVLDPMNLHFMAFEGFRTGWGMHAAIKISGLVLLILFSFIFPYLWCSSVCPLGGLQVLLSDIRSLLRGANSDQKQGTGGRRLFISVMAGTLAGLLAPGLFLSDRKKVIRPPFSLEEENLNMICARCGNCSNACPTGIIKPMVDISAPERLLTPVVEFKDSYCTTECNRCGITCPTGAIQHFLPEEKRYHVMGLAVIEPGSCYLQSGRECSLCVTYCDYDAVEIVKSPDFPSGMPRVDENCCVGCGACQVICPPGIISIT